MPEKRRRFSPQFRAESVHMVIETGKPVAAVARDLGINDGTLGNQIDGRGQVTIGWYLFDSQHVEP